MNLVKIATYVLLGFLLLLQYPLWFGSGGVFAVWRLHREIAAQQQENLRLKDRNQTLEAEVNDLKQGLAAAGQPTPYDQVAPLALKAPAFRSLVNPDDPLKPLIDNIVNGNILGVCLFAGCNDAKVVQDLNFVELVKELVKENVLILCTGCAAGSFARPMPAGAWSSWAGRTAAATWGASSSSTCATATA